MMLRDAAIRRTRDDRTRLWPVLLPLLAGLYLLLHPYRGLVHDARIYTLQALNLLHPELYGTDVYLKHGSQDAFTLFSPLYAGIASLIGPEHAAALITLVSTGSLLCAAWWLARALMPSSLAWLGVGALIIFPGFYGPDEFFEILEGFVTPRLPAQALVLAAVAAWLRGWRGSCAVMFATGLLLHPIMAFCGVAFLLLNWCLFHWRVSWTYVLGVALVASIGVASLQWSRLQFDATWWPVVARENLLLLGEWNSHDWARITTVLTTLVYGAAALPGTARRLALGMAAACCAALLLSFVGGDLLKLVIVIQSQPWRVLWLATVLALLLLPAIAVACWQGSDMRRAGLLLLMTSWMLGHQEVAFLFSIPSLLTVALWHASAPARLARLVVRGSGIAMIVAALCVVAISFSEHAVEDVGTAPAWKYYVAALTANWVAPALLLLAFWKLAQEFTGRPAGSRLTLLATFLVAPLAAASSRPWLEETYPDSVRDSFAAWRAEIPVGSDVLWATDLMAGSDPSIVWLILERPSYYSSVQVNSALFSRAAAMELQQRHQAIPVALPTEQALEVTFDTDRTSPVECRDLPVRHVISDIEIAGARTIPAPPSVPEPFDRLKLQVCPQQ